MKKRFLFFSIAFLLVLSSSFLLASFEKGDSESSIDYSYGPEGIISGWINMSFEEEPVDSSFIGNVGTNSYEITLKEVLENSQGYSYSCDNENCDSYYSEGPSNKSKEFNLNKGNSKIMGFYFNDENIKGVENISFNIESDALKNCVNQIEIDLFDNGEVDFVNQKSSSGICESSYGCFDNVTEKIKDVSVSMVCQRISFPVGPSFQIGASLKEGTGEGNLSAEIHGISGGYLTDCDLDESLLNSNEFTEIGCEVDFSVSKSSDYYVCIYNDGDIGDYFLKGSSSEKCGFPGSPASSESEVGSYSIFRTKKEFASPSFQIIDSYDLGISDSVYNYIYTNLTNGTMNCSKGCIVPMRITSNINNQGITLNNLDLDYEGSIGSSTDSNFYTINKIPAKVNSSFGKIPLNVFNFTAPSDSGEFDFVLNYGGDEIINEDNLSVRNVTEIISIYPQKTAVAYPTTFSLRATSTENISSFNWSFGDNTSKTTFEPNVEHSYDSEGNFTLKVIAIYGDGTKVSGSSRINVGVPDEIIAEALSEKKSKLNNLKSDISESGFSNKILNKYLGVDNLSNQINDLETRYQNNKSTENLKSVLLKLLSLDIPLSVNKIKSTDSITFIPDENDIDVGAVAEIGGGNFSDEGAYRDAISSWSLENLDSKISFNQLSIKYSENFSKGLSTFKISLNPLSSGKKYFVFFEQGMFEFVENYSMSSIYNYDVLELEGSGEIVFYTEQSAEFSEIPVFFSPPLSELSVIEGPAVTDTTDESMKWGLLIFVFIGLIILGIVGYVLLQKWYDKKYEDYLFKDKNQLYNLINYVNTSKQKAMTDSEIKEKLKKVGWKSEQINYVLKKYAGKETGLKKLFSFGGGKKKLKKAKQKQKIQQRRPIQ